MKATQRVTNGDKREWPNDWHGRYGQCLDTF